MSSAEKLLAQKLSEFAPGDLPIRRIQFGSQLSDRAYSGIKFYNQTEIGKVFSPHGELGDLAFRIRIGSYFPSRRDLGQNFIDKFITLNPPRVWQPEINQGLKRHLKDRTRNAMAHDKDDFVTVPQGAIVGVSVIAEGDVSPLADNFNPYSKENLRVHPDHPEGYVDDEGRFVYPLQQYRTRSGIMVAASWDQMPLLIHQSFGEFGYVEPQWTQMQSHFTTFQLLDRDRSALVLPGRTINSPLQGQSNSFRNVVTNIPSVLTVTVFEADEELINAEIDNIQGYELPRFHNHELEDTGRCAVCGKVGRETDFAFEMHVRRQRTLQLVDGSVRKLFEQRIAFVTPEYDEDLEVKGKVMNSCETCFPSPCHGMHFLPGETPPAHCPACNRTWRHGHVCNNPKGYIDPDFLASISDEYQKRLVTREHQAEVPLDVLLEKPLSEHIKSFLSFRPRKGKSEEAAGGQNETPSL